MFWRAHFPVAAIVAASLAIISACAGALWLVDATGQELITRLERDAVGSELDLYSELRREEGDAALARDIARHARIAGEHHIYALARADNTLLGGNLTAWPLLPADTDWFALPTTDGPDSIHASVRVLHDGTQLLIGRDDSMHRRFNGAVMRVAELAILIVALACLLAPGLLIFMSIRSVGELSATASAFSAGRFSARTPTHGGSDPFERIAAAQNAMLDRIEDLITGLKTVTDSLAHDLRTPLARLRTTLERGVAAREPEAKQAALEAGVRETEKTIFAFSSLIDIARAEGGLSRDAMTNVDLAALLHDVHELFLPLAEDYGVALSVEACDVSIQGHKPLLMQAVGNLVHNAIKHSPTGSTLELTLARDASGPRIVVADRGPGIPEDQRANAVKRFKRLGAGDTPEGVGLGLAIVEACAHLHRGALVLEDNKPGLRAALVLRA
ncbi:ATP-binding protein [Terricaulis sp.]|uniref:sensor histidine kinase n=1 Tax=Terricaulis sp. TaxID=2768686 RepID=UPI0037834C9F